MEKEKEDIKKEEKSTGNIDVLKKYLKANGLDESIAGGPFFAEKFKEIREDGTRYFVYYEDDKNIIHGRDGGFRDKHSDISDFRIKKIGKTIILEELKTAKPRRVHYSIDEDGPDSMNYYHREVDMYKLTTFIDENGNRLAEELRKATLDHGNDSKDMPTEKDLYSGLAEVKYAFDKENFAKAIMEDHNSDNPGGYQIVENIKKIDNLQKENKELENKNMENKWRLSRAIEFAEKVKAHPIGKLFFGGKVKGLEGLVDDKER